MREDEVYRASKKWFVDQEFQLLAGQPPRGTDRLPVVEIKAPNGKGKGSLGSFKPDLIVANSNVVLIVECKPRYDKGDVEKLLSIRDDLRRLDALVSELRQRRLFERRGLGEFYPSSESIRSSVRYAVSYEGTPEVGDEIYSLVFEEGSSMMGSLYRGLMPISSIV